MDSLTILILPIHEHEISFHSFVSSSVSFISVIVFSVFIVLVKFIPRYFILFNAIVNRIIFLISILNSLLLVYRNTTDFCILILYPVTLLNSFISSKFFGGVFKVFYMKDCHFQIVTVLLFSDLDFLFVFIVVFIFVLMALGKTFNTMLDKSGKSGHSCLILGLRGETYSFPLLDVMLAVGLSHMALSQHPLAFYT